MGNMSIEERFIAALQNQSLQELRTIEKSDLHNHAIMGGSIRYLSDSISVRLNSVNNNFSSISEMDAWSAKNIDPYFIGFKGYLKRIEAAFLNALHDGVSHLCMSFSLGEVISFREPSLFIKLVTRLHKKYAPNIVFLPELSICRDSRIDFATEKVNEILSFNWFKSIDICGDELYQPIKNFAKIYRIAQSKNLILKAHVGEFGFADDVCEAVEVLCLSQVHHGISACNSQQVMRWLSKNNIQLNICPTSNIKLGIISSYKNHPIKTLYDYGIPVSINTDDMLLFNQSVSEEYLNLFRANTLSAKELNEIRLRGLKCVDF